MAIRFSCPSCGAAFNIADNAAGKSATCPKCQASIKVPARGVPVPDTSPPPAPSAPTPPAAEILDEPPAKDGSDWWEREESEVRKDESRRRRRSRLDDPQPEDEPLPAPSYSHRQELSHYIPFGQAVKMGMGLGIGFWLAWLAITLFAFAISMLLFCLVTGAAFSSLSGSSSPQTKPSMSR